MTDEEIRILAASIVMCPSETVIRGTIEKAIKAERERCARVCEATRPVPGSTWHDAVIVCAAAIRKGQP